MTLLSYGNLNRMKIRYDWLTVWRLGKLSALYNTVFVYFSKFGGPHLLVHTLWGLFHSFALCKYNLM